jgi:uncharacterized membrane protein YkvA (DUF1232 family)
VKRRFLRAVLARAVPFFSRHPGLLTILALGYIISPIDLLPEAFLGPIGGIDDLIVLVGSIYLSQMLRQRRERARRRRPPP